MVFRKKFCWLFLYIIFYVQTLSQCLESSKTGQRSLIKNDKDARQMSFIDWLFHGAQESNLENQGMGVNQNATILEHSTSNRTHVKESPKLQKDEASSEETFHQKRRERSNHEISHSELLNDRNGYFGLPTYNFKNPDNEDYNSMQSFNPDQDYYFLRPNFGFQGMSDEQELLEDYENTYPAKVEPMEHSRIDFTPFVERSNSKTSQHAKIDRKMTRRDTSRINLQSKSANRADSIPNDPIISTLTPSQFTTITLTLPSESSSASTYAVTNSNTPTVPIIEASSSSSPMSSITPSQNPSFTSTPPTNSTSSPAPSFSPSLNCQCGVQSISGDSHGPALVRIATHPWVVEIHTKANHHLCTGTIINNKYILTAANCVKKYDKSKLQVVTGMQIKAAKFFDVVKVSIHPKYNEKSLTNNIAVLKMSRTIIPNAKMRPICLPIKSANMTYRTGHLVSWVQDGRQKFPLHLLNSEVEILNSTECERSIRENDSAGNGTICTTPPGRIKCVETDLGAALQVYAGKYSYEQIGLLSRSGGCRTNGTNGVYTDVRSYIRWILFQTQDAEYCKAPKISDMNETINAMEI